MNKYREQVEEIMRSRHFGNVTATADEILALIREAQMEAIGDDEHAYNQANKKHRTCAYCGVDEGAYHHDGCESLIESIRNHLRVELRQQIKRAEQEEHS